MISANEKMINYHKNWEVMWRALKGSWLYGIKLNPLQLGFNDITLEDTMTTITFLSWRAERNCPINFKIQPKLARFLGPRIFRLIDFHWNEMKNGSKYRPMADQNGSMMGRKWTALALKSLIDMNNRAKISQRLWSNFSFSFDWFSNGTKGCLMKNGGIKVVDRQHEPCQKVENLCHKCLNGKDDRWKML